MNFTGPTDLPSISNTGYASSSMVIGHGAGAAGGLAGCGTGGGGTEPSAIPYHGMMDPRLFMKNQYVPDLQVTSSPTQEIKPMPKRRVVQVFIADTDENVPLENCVIYRGEQKLTDATDQELFFELDIKSLLDKHNKLRIGFLDKSVKERDEYLEPVKVRDLKMIVVTVAEF